MITHEQLEILSDIFSSTERIESIDIKLDQVTKSITVQYYDIDDAWFVELTEAATRERGT